MYIIADNTYHMNMTTTQLCVKCQSPFGITDDDRAFLERVSPEFNGKKELVPSPTHCPRCRMQRRLAFRNNGYYEHRTCDLTGNKTISIHGPDSGYTVYDQKAWWGDGWDPLSYGKDFDFSRPFFEQFRELQLKVPRMSLQQLGNENSEYTNYVSYLKNCYMLTTSDFNQDCYYGFWIERSKDCVNNFLIDSCERASGSIFSIGIYNSRDVYFSANCSDCNYLVDCRGCRSCTLCSGLRNKEYCFENMQYSKEEYERKVAGLTLHTHSGTQQAKETFYGLIRAAIHPPIHKQGTVNDSSGDFLIDTDNCTDCYEVMNGKDCKHVIGGVDIKDVRDCCYANGELAYENCECFPAPYQSCFNLNSYTGRNLLYCDMCMNECQNLFGCVSLKKAKYCILNKQYSKEEYEALVPKIIDHMRQAGEWGEYFPVALSPFGYNQSEAFDDFPLTQEQTMQSGWKWTEQIDRVAPDTVQAASLPDAITDVTDDITKQTIACEVTGKAFKIIPQELRYYRDTSMPLPRRSPEQRRIELLSARNPRHLFERPCMHCSKPMQTTYAPDRPEMVYCERCYLEAVY